MAENPEPEMKNFHGGHFGFTGAEAGALASLATEYTCACIVGDRSGSSSDFQKEMEKAKKAVLEACKKRPGADNLLLRDIVFSDDVTEIHGYKLLEHCDPADYDGSMEPEGLTALHDAVVNGIESMTEFAKTLVDQDMDVNGIMVVITDGWENRSTIRDPAVVKKAIQAARKSEALESIVLILVAVNEAEAGAELKKFHKDVGFTQYIGLPDASPSTIAKLAAFISQSVSSQSQALGSGGPSQPVAF
jgi:hypothetical protein